MILETTTRLLGSGLDAGTMASSQAPDPSTPDHPHQTPSGVKKTTSLFLDHPTRDTAKERRQEDVVARRRCGQCASQVDQSITVTERQLR
jgi:hypothetical protein